MQLVIGTVIFIFLFSNLRLEGVNVYAICRTSLCHDADSRCGGSIVIVMESCTHQSCLRVASAPEPGEGRAALIEAPLHVVLRAAPLRQRPRRTGPPSSPAALLAQRRHRGVSRAALISY